MGAKFELHTEVKESAAAPPGRHAVLRNDRCISCGECIRRCIYGVHSRSEANPRELADPVSEQCRSCLVCPQTCPRRALTVTLNPELDAIGVAPFDADAVLTGWSEALDGKIPVRGAGYAGPFRGWGFDGIWTDMSEIVRPTRDGIHGREYISTEFDLGRKLPDLSGLRFDAEGRLLDRIPLTREIPVPIMFGRMPLGPGGLRTNASMVRAAMELKTFGIMDLEGVRSLARPRDPDAEDAHAIRYLEENRNHIVLHLGLDCFDKEGRLLDELSVDPEAVLPMMNVASWASVVELADSPAALDQVDQLRSANPDLLVIIEVPASPDAPARVVELAQGGVDAIHLAAGWCGTWDDGQGDHTVIVRAIRETHLALVEAGIRDELSLLVSGGIARAEHLPKAILLGADAVVLDVPLLIALGCRVCRGCMDSAECVEGLGTVDAHWGARRIVNMMAAWRNQLLEVLGAMGMREVRRLRGEVGRGLFADQLEESFFDRLKPLEESERPLTSVEGPDDTTRPPHPSRMLRSYGPYRVTRSEGCEACGACVEQCHHGALTWPGGLQKPPPPIDEKCVGTGCGGDCVGACPAGRIRVEEDDRLGVVEHTRWTHRLVAETWNRAAGHPPARRGPAAALGESDGGFDLLELVADGASVSPEDVDLSMELNRRGVGPTVSLPLPVYGGGMSYGSISDQVMLGRARAVTEIGTLTCTGEGGFPGRLKPYASSIITQVATGYFGVSEETIKQTRMVEFKYAQGAKPGLGGHLLGDKNTPRVAELREAVPGTALFSPFPFHSVYSIEDHRKHVDWVRAINPDVLVSVKVSTPGDVDMVAVGSYHAGANVVHLDGAYGGTGAAPEVAKKNIAMPIELALAQTHQFLQSEGIRDEIVLIASGGIRTPMDVVKAIAMGADGVVIGTAELVAIECVLCRNCEKDRGCPRGIATTDRTLESYMNADWVTGRIINLYRSWERELRWILARLGCRSVGELRGRSDLLRYRERSARTEEVTV